VNAILEVHKKKKRVGCNCGRNGGCVPPIAWNRRIEGRRGLGEQRRAWNEGRERDTMDEFPFYGGRSLKYRARESHDQYRASRKNNRYNREEKRG